MGSWAEGTDKQTSASADISKNTEASCEWTSVTKDHHHTTRSPSRAVPRTAHKRPADKLRRHEVSCVSPGALRNKSAFYTFCPDPDCLTERIGGLGSVHPSGHRTSGGGKGLTGQSLTDRCDMTGGVRPVPVKTLIG